MQPKSVLVLLDPVSIPRLEGISRFAREHAWNLMFADRLLADVGDWSGDGVLVTLRGGEKQLKAVARLRRRGIPVVDLTIACPSVKMPRVISDHAGIGALAARHFRERGFETLAWYSSRWSNVHALRYNGFRQEVGRPAPMKWTAANLSERLREAPKPIGVLAFDDVDAARVLAACRTASLRVPEDVSVLGIGNDPFLCENQSTPISSVDQNLSEAAFRGAALLQRLMNGERTAETEIIPPLGLTPRASTDTHTQCNPMVRDTLLYIHRNLSKPFGAAQVAADLSIPRAHLDRLFSTEVGHSIGNEILRQRLLRVKRLLADRSVPISRIARACGFCNPAYLTNVFRQETGVTPKAWRNAH